MNQLLLLFFIAICTLSNGQNNETSSLFSSKQIEVSFGNFKTIFRRLYRSLTTETDRLRIFGENLEYIESFNSRRDAFRTYTLGVNNFTDLSQDEFHRLYNGFIQRTQDPSSAAEERRAGRTLEVNVTEEMLRQRLPRTVDWSQRGVLTPVKQQGQCGSCWSFAAVAAIESQVAIHTGQLVSLSEQNLLDCAVYGNNGCAGGLMNNAYEYVIQNGGIDTADSYPYLGAQRYCRFNTFSVGAQISSYVNLQRGSEAELMYALAHSGPVSVGMDASRQSLQFYSSGVYDDPSCSSYNLNHGVVVVGYGTTTDGVDYFKVKNSWGQSWGMGGYFLIRRNAGNRCGIATQASYPVL
ncbi:PREDICTED: cathepsin L1-like [Rhagoletis zephyria]|uniref:cathepsin L1-like n=1 Tax=Rhagoletis zephyria TaxID=28612 RepID=UPI000811A12B|nr:PREDICTED: cathepsin L1-like [Rhagoletis zephyria]